METMTDLDWIREAEQTFQSTGRGQNESVACMAASMISGSFFLLFNHVCPLQMSSVEGRVEHKVQGSQLGAWQISLAFTASISKNSFQGLDGENSSLYQQRRTENS